MLIVLGASPRSRAEVKNESRSAQVVSREVQPKRKLTCGGQGSQEPVDSDHHSAQRIVGVIARLDELKISCDLTSGAIPQPVKFGDEVGKVEGLHPKILLLLPVVAP